MGKLKDTELWLIITLSSAITLCIGAVIVIYYESKPQEKVEIIETTPEVLAFSDSVKSFINFIGIDHPDIVYKQALVESGNFTSNIFKQNNNLFGMRKSYSRPNTQTGVNLGYATYDNWQMSVIDYALWQTWSAKKLKREDYLKLLGSSYAEDSDYIRKVK